MRGQFQGNGWTDRHRDFEEPDSTRRGKWSKVFALVVATVHSMPWLALASAKEARRWLQVCTDEILSASILRVIYRWYIAGVKRIIIEHRYA